MSAFRVKSMRVAVASALLAMGCGAAFAVPSLQLGILGGTYDGGTETGVATTNPFKLYAFLLPGDKTATLDEFYYISAALVPKTGPADSALGSFKFGSTTVSATTDMTYGSPPLDAVLQGQQGDLQSHGIFDTFFSEFKFKFDAANTVGSINTQDDPDLSGLAAGTGAKDDLYYAIFDIDVSLLDTPLHFDLYNQKVKDCSTKGKDAVECTTVGTDDFAPFSHDAQSGGSSSSSSSSGGASSSGDIPEPNSGTMALLGLGLLAGSFAWRRRVRGL